MKLICVMNLILGVSPPRVNDLSLSVLFAQLFKLYIRGSELHAIRASRRFSPTSF